MANPEKEKITGSTRERPELQKLLDQLREGDIVVMLSISRGTLYNYLRFRGVAIPPSSAASKRG